MHITRTLALIGAGYWGKNLARNFHALGALHTICDACQSTLDSYGSADYDGVQKTNRLDAVLADTAITSLAVAAPAALHHNIVKAALEAGKDVYVEKPLCLDVPEAEELVKLADAKGRVLMVGHLLQYHPCVQKLQALVAQGELGKLHYITSNRLNLGKIRREENALWSFAPHDISVILSLAANQLPEQIRCTGEAYLNTRVVDTTLTSLRFADKVRAHIYVTWLNPFKEQKLTVVGSHGMAVFDDTRPWAEKLILHRHYITWTDGQTPTPSKNNKGEPVPVPEAEPLRQECLHFLECCRDRRTPRTDGQEGLRVLRVLQAAQLSLEADGHAVSLLEGRAPARPAIESGIQNSESRNFAPFAPLREGKQPSLCVPASQELRPPPQNIADANSKLETRDSKLNYFAHPTAVVDDGAEIGEGTKVWHFCHIMKGAKIGKKCVFGQNVNVDGGTVIGNNVKVQNNVSIYTGVTIEDDVFLGPSCVLTNVTNPRSQVNRHSLYERTLIKRGATIGANATIVCGVTIGRYAFIGAGAVVTKDVPDYALMLGNPARQKGWMSRHGHVLKNPDANRIMTCPESGYRYQLTEFEIGNSNFQMGSLRCLDLDEESPLPAELAAGKIAYREIKKSQK
jgi:UDP-2-acetamido-3-amino-2,3-dideoxy-glucuronate N-acetyltransferase